jgi:hypothetical protein
MDSSNPRNMTEEQIQEFLVGELGKPTSVRYQKKLLDKVLEIGRKKFGAISDSTLQVESLRYFLARGVLNWEEENLRKPRKGS